MYIHIYIHVHKVDLHGVYNSLDMWRILAITCVVMDNSNPNNINGTFIWCF